MVGDSVYPLRGRVVWPFVPGPEAGAPVLAGTVVQTRDSSAVADHHTEREQSDFQAIAKHAVLLSAAVMMAAAEAEWQRAVGDEFCEAATLFCVQCFVHTG